jgi:hypothetical protein
MGRQIAADLLRAASGHLVTYEQRRRLPNIRSIFIHRPPITFFAPIES